MEPTEVTISIIEEDIMSLSDLTDDDDTSEIDSMCTNNYISESENERLSAINQNPSDQSGILIMERSVVMSPVENIVIEEKEYIAKELLQIIQDMRKQLNKLETRVRELSLVNKI